MEEIKMVEETLMESAEIDQPQAPDTDSLSEVLAADEPAAEGAEDQLSLQEERKALRGRMKRYETQGYNRGKREAEAAWAEEKRGYEARLAKYAERDLEDEAKALAAEQHISYDFALEHVRMKKGLPQAAPEPKQTEQTNAENAQARQRAGVLMAQAEAFEKFTDGEVTRDQILEAFQSDPEIRRGVQSGEMDFTDVGKRLAGGAQRAPRIARTPNDGSMGKRSISTMSEAAFNELNERVKHGAVFDARR